MLQAAAGQVAERADEGHRLPSPGVQKELVLVGGGRSGPQALSDGLRAAGCRGGGLLCSSRRGGARVFVLRRRDRPGPALQAVRGQHPRRGAPFAQSHTPFALACAAALSTRLDRRGQSITHPTHALPTAVHSEPNARGSHCRPPASSSSSSSSVPAGPPSSSTSSCDSPGTSRGSRPPPSSASGLRMDW